MIDRVYKYYEFITEAIHDTPETYIHLALKKLKKRLERMFTSTEVVDGEVKRFGEKEDLDRKEKGEMSFRDLGLQIQSLELSKYSKLYDNVKLKFSDEEFLYDITFTIDLRDGLPKDKEKDYSDTEVKNCQIKFKKYSLNDFELVAGPLVKTIEIDKIDEEYLIELKIELEESDDSGEEFEIETE
jgi:hypothetical protein